MLAASALFAAPVPAAPTPAPPAGSEGPPAAQRIRPTIVSHGLDSPRLLSFGPARRALRRPRRARAATALRDRRRPARSASGSTGSLTRIRHGHQRRVLTSSRRWPAPAAPSRSGRPASWSGPHGRYFLFDRHRPGHQGPARTSGRAAADGHLGDRALRWPPSAGGRPTSLPSRPGPTNRRQRGPRQRPDRLPGPPPPRSSAPTPAATPCCEPADAPPRSPAARARPGGLPRPHRQELRRRPAVKADAGRADVGHPGPDGALYVSQSTGFPFPVQVRRALPKRARHATTV